MTWYISTCGIMVNVCVCVGGGGELWIQWFRDQDAVIPNGWLL
jgi:hypothetical protein